MGHRIIGGILFILITTGFWFLNNLLPEYQLGNLTKSFVAITVTYFFFKVFVWLFITKRVQERKVKHLFIRLNNSLFYLLTVFWLLTIWVENTETLLLSYGLLSAALAFALQDIFKDIIGGFVLLGSGNYRVGDRIEIDGLIGDVVKISLLYTTVMEIKNWVSGDQPTGRLSMIPNGRVTHAIVHNYTKDHEFIWDELVIPITYDSSWREAVEKIQKILEEKQVHVSEKAEKQIEELSKRYYIEKRAIEPNVFIHITDNWIELHVRYITDTINRRSMQSDISGAILEEIQKSKKITIASETIRVIS